MELYRLEACPTCKVVRVAMLNAVNTQKMKDGTDRPIDIWATTVYWRECNSCDAKCYSTPQKEAKESGNATT